MFSKVTLAALAVLAASVEAQNCTTTVTQWFNASTTCTAWASSAQTSATAVQTGVAKISNSLAACGVPNIGGYTPGDILMVPTAAPTKTALIMQVLGACAATTNAPTKNPTTPTTRAPTKNPTVPTTRKPTTNPTVPTTRKPTTNPTTPTTRKPTKSPVRTPTKNPTLAPTVGPAHSCTVAVCNQLVANYTTLATTSCAEGVAGGVTASNCAGYTCNAEAIKQCEGTATNLNSDFFWGFTFVKTICNSVNTVQTNCTALLPLPPAPTPGSASALAASAVSAVAVVAALFSA